MKQIKKGIILLLILTTIYYIIPYAKEDVETLSVETVAIVEITEEITEEEIIEEEIQEAEIEYTIEKIYELNNNTNLKTKSNISAEEYNKMLSNTALNGIGEYIYNAEQKYSVNGLYIMGLACLESAYGKSNYAVNRNNLFGYNAVDSNPNKATSFSSKESCIMYVAEKLSTNYLSEDGCYFSGYTAKDIDKHYCSDKQHANKIINIVNKLVKEVV